MKRLQLSLTSAVHDRLVRLVKVTESPSMIETIRRALVVYEDLENRSVYFVTE